MYYIFFIFFCFFCTLKSFAGYNDRVDSYNSGAVDSYDGRRSRDEDVQDRSDRKDLDRGGYYRDSNTSSQNDDRYSDRRKNNLTGCPYFNNGAKILYFYNSLGTSSFAIRVALHCMGVNYKSILVDLKKHEYLSDKGEVKSFYDKNAKGTVPYIEYGDFNLSEGVAILSYLADKCQSFNPNNVLRYKILEIINFVATDIYRNITPIFGKCLNRNGRECFINKTKEELDRLDKILGEKDFFVQDMSIADCYVLAILMILGASPIDLNDYPNLNRFYNFMQQQPCVREALRREIEENKRVASQE